MTICLKKTYDKTDRDEKRRETGDKVSIADFQYTLPSSASVLHALSRSILSSNTPQNPSNSYIDNQMPCNSPSHGIKILWTEHCPDKQMRSQHSTSYHHS